MCRRYWLLVGIAGFLIHAHALAQADNWGAVQGRAIWPDQNLPKPQVLAPGIAGCPAAIPGEKWVVNQKNGGIRWVLVWLDPLAPNQKLPINPTLKAAPKVTMDQPQCAFEPHVLAMREGQILEAKNSANFAHNFNYTGNAILNPGDNPLIPAGKSIEIKNLKAQELPISVACGIHPWMNAKVAVFSHPYFAVTDSDGKFKIAGAPLGKCRLKIWHEEIGFLNAAQGGRKLGKVIAVQSGTATDLGEIKLEKNK